MSDGGEGMTRAATLAAAGVSVVVLATIVLAALAATPTATVGVRIPTTRVTTLVVFPRSDIREDGYPDGHDLVLRVPATRHVAASPARSLVSFSYSILDNPLGDSAAALSRPVIPAGTAITMCEQDFPADRCKGRRFTFHTLRAARLSKDCILSVFSLSECSAAVPVVADILGPAANMAVPFATTGIRIRLRDGTPVSVDVDAAYTVGGGADAHLAVDPSVRQQELAGFWRDVQHRIGRDRVVVGGYSTRTDIDHEEETSRVVGLFVNRASFLARTTSALRAMAPTGMRLLPSTVRAEPALTTQILDRSLGVDVVGDAASINEQGLAELLGDRSRGDAQRRTREVGGVLAWIRETWTPRRRLPPANRVRVVILNPA